jgi:hypothetical protein
MTRRLTATYTRTDQDRHARLMLTLARHADPRTAEHYDRGRGNLDRHGVHFLTVYVAGVLPASIPPTKTHQVGRLSSTTEGSRKPGSTTPSRS